MSGVSYSSAEAIGLKIWSLEKEALYEKDEKKNSNLNAQITALWWVANLLCISKDVSDTRQRMSLLSNKTWQAAQEAVLEDSKKKKYDF